MRLLLGTRNPGKQREIAAVLEALAAGRGVSLGVVRPGGARSHDDSEDAGAAFGANSRDTARAYCRRSGLPTIADGGGLEIHSLGGEPGVRSRRWPGQAADDETLIRYALERLAEYPAPEDRGARLRTCITYLDDTVEGQECAAVEGTIATEASPRRVAGYPYRALFVVKSIGKYYDELTADEHAAVNHRARALRQLFETLIVTRALEAR